jgi:hypothetical protein
MESPRSASRTPHPPPPPALQGPLITRGCCRRTAPTARPLAHLHPDTNRWTGRGLWLRIRACAPERRGEGGGVGHRWLVRAMPPGPEVGDGRTQTGRGSGSDRAGGAPPCQRCNAAGPSSSDGCKAVAVACASPLRRARWEMPYTHLNNLVRDPGPHAVAKQRVRQVSPAVAGDKSQRRAMADWPMAWKIAKEARASRCHTPQQRTAGSQRACWLAPVELRRRCPQPSAAGQ